MFWYILIALLLALLFWIMTKILDELRDLRYEWNTFFNEFSKRVEYESDEHPSNGRD